MTLQGPIVIGTDLTPRADEALRQAHRLATDLGSALIVCHVLPELLSVRVLFPQWAGVDPQAHEALTAKALAAVEQQLVAVVGGTSPSVSIMLDSGSPHAGLLTQAEAAGAGLIVTGPGRVAGRVVRHATVPVLIARPSPHGVVIGATDFSDPSLPALETAAFEARRRKSPLHLLHVVDLGAYALGGAGGGLPYLGETPIVALQSLDDLRAAAQARLEETLKQFAIVGRASAVSGPAAGTIIGVAESSGAELLVVGTHGRSGFARMALGSTAEAVIDSAPCSVLVVRLARE